MKYPLECIEDYEDPAYDAEMSFGEQVVKVNVKAIHHRRGERFSARNKKERDSALATGKWKLNQ